MESCKFSRDGHFLAVCGLDGRLRVWDAKDKLGSLKQEFIPSSHLSATCSCLEWGPVVSTTLDKRKRKRKGFEGDLVAMGAGDGSVLFYSVAKSQLVGHTKPGHSGKVMDLGWSEASMYLYSCGEDGFLVEWDVENLKSLSRWKGGKGQLTSICVFKDMLLSAGRGITLWSLETKTSIMNFMGQSSSISHMEQIHETDYFVTMSFREMHLQIWSKSEQSAVATLMLTENPRHFSVMSSSDAHVSIAAVTERGNLCTFQHKLNGPLRKPLAPSCVLTIMDTNDASEQVPVLTSFLTKDEDTTEVKLAYGSWLGLKFESMPMKFLQDKITIKRNFSVKSKVSKKGRHQKECLTDVTEVPKDAKHLQPGSEVELLKPVEAKTKGKKRKKGEEASKEDVEELPMEERLSNLTIDAPAAGQVPDGSNLAHLLSQGLHSKDAKILESVLSRWDQDVIDSTVRSLPVQLLVPLLTEVKKMLTNKPTLNYSVVKWLKAIFRVHSAFLMTCPSSEDLLGPFMSLLHSKEAVFPQMCQLQGKLALVKGNIESKQHRTEVPNEALLVYHDESSDEGDEDEIIPSESEEFIGSDDLVEDDESSESDEEEAGDSEASSDETDDAAAPKVNGDIEESMDEDE